MKNRSQGGTGQDTPRVVSLSVPGQMGLVRDMSRCPAMSQMSRRDPETLAAKYRQGLTLRQIGAEIGVCHQTARYHLLKLKGYSAMVTQMLLARFRAAGENYAITRARADRRRLKHTQAMIRRHRPELARQLTERARPKACPECSQAITAKQCAGLWFWGCAHCGGSGIVPLARIASPQARNETPVRRSKKNRGHHDRDHAGNAR